MKQAINKKYTTKIYLHIKGSLLIIVPRVWNIRAIFSL
jgi:hypothetical protein